MKPSLELGWAMAVQTVDPCRFIMRFIVASLAYLTILQNWPSFSHSWARRSTLL